MAYRFQSEDEHSFTVHDGKSSFQIGKRALPAPLHGKIRGLPKVEAFAEGGEVGAAGSIWEAAKRWFESASGAASQEASKNVAEEVSKAIPSGVSSREATLQDRARYQRMEEQTGPQQNMAEGGAVEAADITAQPPIPDTPPQVPGQDFLGNVWAQHFQDVRGRPPTSADFAPPEQTQQPAPYPPGVQLEQAHETAPVPLAPSHEPWQAPLLPQSPDASAAAAQYSGVPNYGGIMGRMFSAEKLQEQGVRGQAAAAGQRSQEEAGALDTYTRAMQEHEARFEQQFDGLTKEHDAIVDDIKNTRINPQRLWQSKSASDKSSAMIGMILSGIGSAMAGQPNLALQVLDKQIERDIDAQKMELGKKESLLSDNLRKTGNLFQATSMTRLQMAATLEGQMKLAAARSGSADAQARADQAIGQLRMNLIQPMMQMAQFQAISGMVQAGQGGGAGYVKSSALPPMPSEFSLKGVVEARKDMNERRVDLPELGAGSWTLAKTPKDAEEIRQSFASMGNLERQVQKLGQLARVHGTAIHIPNTAASAEYDATASSVVTELNKLQDLNRLNENEYKSFGNMIPTTREWLTPAGQAKFQSLMSRIQGKRVSEYTHRLGLDPKLLQRKSETPMGVR